MTETLPRTTGIVMEHRPLAETFFRVSAQTQVRNGQAPRVRLVFWGDVLQMTQGPKFVVPEGGTSFWRDP